MMAVIFPAGNETLTPSKARTSVSPLPYTFVTFVAVTMPPLVGIFPADGAADVLLMVPTLDVAAPKGESHGQASMVQRWIYRRR